ncbi:MAG: sulfite exporter TauE/SafE family protein [Lachnospiraceae bacterium]|nr:sulfite exporter TauE/SafE family protein [Lachnospiraceae bacterium]
MISSEIMAALGLFLIVGAANGIVGCCIGICGIAGFLLPMLYTGFLDFSVDQALAYSFLAFLISGILGSVNYKKAGNLDVPLSVKLGIGSLLGAVGGVFLQAMITQKTAKALLYLVVLFSGISILIRLWKERKQAKDRKTAGKSRKALTDHLWFLLLLGIVTGAICSLSGAGGPVLVMPLLIIFGVPARAAVGVALFDSVFIAVPACIGYLSRIDMGEALWMLLLIAVTHGIGVLIGSKNADRVPVNALKWFVGIFSVILSLFMLLG